MKTRIFIAITIVIGILIAVSVILNINKGSTPAPVPKNSRVSLSELSQRAKDLEAKLDLVSAKNAYQELVNNFSDSPAIIDWQKKIDYLNIKLLFSPTLTSKSISYQIKPGDTLTKIAREYKTTVDLIKKSNGLSDDKIFPGRKIKVWTTAFTVVVDRSQNLLMLKSDEEVIKTYIVSTGINNSTPLGTFKIANKLTDPTWFKAGAVVPSGSAENILGTRWLGFDLAGYGIHGTIEPQNLGRQVTQGCVRMANSDVEELYTILPLGTEVTIVD